MVASESPPPDPYKHGPLTAAQVQGREDVRPWLVPILIALGAAIVVGFTAVLSWVVSGLTFAFVTLAVIEAIVLAYGVKSVVQLVRSRR